MLPRVSQHQAAGGLEEEMPGLSATPRLEFGSPPTPPTEILLQASTEVRRGRE